MPPHAGPAPDDVPGRMRPGAPGPRPWLPASLGARLLLAATAVILLALAATGAAMELALRRFIQGQVDGRLDTQIITVTDALRPAPDGAWVLDRSVDGPPFDRPGSGWSWVVLAPGPVLASRSRPPRAVAAAEAAPHGPPGAPLTADGRGPDDARLRVRLRRLDLEGRAVTVAAAAPLEAVLGPLWDVMMPVLGILGLLGAALLLGVLLQVRLGLRPLGRLRAELARVRAGRAERIGGPQPREVRPLVAELNQLLDDNHANLERARRNVANLAHGLKTPLATLALAIDRPGSVPDGQLRPLVDRMDRLIRHHLARARAAALGTHSRARVPLAEAVAGHVAVFTKLYADKRLAVAVDIDPGLAAAVEAQDLDEMLGNLLDNASKWATGRVAVAARTDGQRLRLAVEDDGPGIPEDRQADMLKPGQRIDESAPGHGFGLPITRELAELYGGAVSLSRSTLGGLRVALDLPAAA